MRRARGVAPVLLAIALGVSAGRAAGVENDPLPVPKGGARERAVTAYNDGVQLLLDRRYAAAQEKFEEALAADEGLAEAHNNLAFSVRMQGRENFARAMQHYNRALELKPDLAQAYMYRGVLFTQLGDLARARTDHARLLTLDPVLAAKLEAAIAGRPMAEGNDGLAGQYE